MDRAIELRPTGPKCSSTAARAAVVAPRISLFRTLEAQSEFSSQLFECVDIEVCYGRRASGSVDPPK